MPVKIENMDMPKMCETCPVYELTYSRCCITKNWVRNASERRSDCPLKECK